MMRIIRLVFLLGVLLPGVAQAQRGMNINRVFGGKYISDPSVTEVVMSGDQRFLRKHDLTTLATFRGSSATYASILQPLVLADGAKAIGRNVRYKDGKLQYAFFMLQPTVVDGEKLNRYLYYLNTGSKNQSVMLIYFDGALSRSDAEALIESLSK